MFKRKKDPIPQLSSGEMKKLAAQMAASKKELERVRNLELGEQERLYRERRGK